MSDYDRIARAIQYLEQHVQQQPSLEDVAEHVNLSPYHFQRLFSRWAGISPKRFLQVMTVHHAKQMLDESLPIIEVSGQLGLSSSSRLHDHFVALEAMTPGEYQKMGVGMEFVYGVVESPFGLIFVAFSHRGVCRLAFLDEEDPASEIERLYTIWPESILKNDPEAARRLADRIFHSPEELDRPLSLLVAGTNFQIQVWRALLEIPMGRLVSYARVASNIGRPDSARAVGSAVGANPIAFLIPCHRVIHGSGKVDGYRWGGTRKRAMIAWESV